MRIWVDAAAAPRGVREIVHRAAMRLGIEAHVISGDAALPAEPTEPTEPAEPAEPGEASVRIARSAQAGDLVVTQDSRLAGHLVRRGVAAIDVRGGEYTAAAIDEDESVRDLVEQLRASGPVSRGPPPYDDRAKREFASTLDRVLARLRTLKS